MAKIKLTKGELKKQKDSLGQFERYLPTLQLKKQQLQIEILRQLAILEDKSNQEKSRRAAIEAWAGLFAEPGINIRQWIKVGKVLTGTKNIAGVDLPVFEQAEFVHMDYDLFTTPFWVDAAIEAIEQLISLREEIGVVEKGIAVLRQELRITTQRVNLFEKVKIPEAEEAIRLIKIYLGDQMANAVGRCKIAKRKIEELVLEGAAA